MSNLHEEEFDEEDDDFGYGDSGLEAESGFDDPEAFDDLEFDEDEDEE